MENEKENSEKIKSSLILGLNVIDRPLSWIVAIMGCIVLGMHFGLVNAAAIFYPGLMESLGLGLSTVTWVGTGQFAVMFCLSPLYNRLLDYIPYRAVVFIGPLISSLSLMGASYAKSFEVFLLLYVVSAGIGLGITVVRLVGIAAEYFDRYRVLALAIIMSGAGLGTFLIAKVGGLMIDELTWRVALMGMGVIHLNIIPASLLIRPLPPTLAAEPTILYPDHQGDLSSTTIPELGDQHLIGKNLFASILSVTSVQGISDLVEKMSEHPRPKTHSNRAVLAAQDLRAVIEFVKGTHDTRTGVNIIEQPTFLSDPGILVNQQIAEAVERYTSENDIDTSVLIPLIFIVGEVETALAATQRYGPITGEQLRDLISSITDMGIRPDKIAQPDSNQLASSCTMIGDGYISATVIGEEKRLMRKTIRSLIDRAQKRVTEVGRLLSDRGTHVCKEPIIALIDQSEYFQVNGVDRVINADASNVLGYQGPSEEPIEELAEQGDWNYEQKTESSSEDVRTKRTSISKPQLPKLSVYSRSSSFITGQPGTEMQFFHKGSITRNSPQDFFISVISVRCEKEAVDLLVEKIENLTSDEKQKTFKEKLRNLVLFNPMFLSFLFSRLLVYLTDSVVFAHLNNLGIENDIPEEQAAGLLSFVGLANMFARLGTGLIGLYAPKCDKRILTAACLLLASIYTTVIPLFPTYASLSVFGLVYGMLASPSFAFAPLMALEIIGTERYDEAVAFWFQFEAIGYLVGGPIGAAIKEINDKYIDCYAFAGACDLGASLILFAQALVLSGFYGKMKNKYCKKIDLEDDCSEEEDVYSVSEVA